MNTPKIRFKGFEEAWKENKLCDIANITMGQSPNSENYTNDSNDTLLIQGNADLNNGKVIPRLFTKQITKTCDINDIIMTVRAPVGDIAISDYNACIGRGVCSIKASKFVYHYLDYLKIKDYWKKISKGSTIDSITSDDIKSLLIKMPNKQEEEKIIKTIDLVNKKIELQSRKIEDLKLFKKGLANKIFKDSNNNSKIKNLDITISDGNYGEQYPRQDELNDYGEVPFLRVNNLKRLKITDENMKYISKSKHSSLLSGHLKENDILITTRGEIGLLAIVDKKHEDSNINAQIALLRINDYNKILPKYLLQYLDYNSKYIQTLQTGSALKQLPIKNLLSMNVYIPDIETQKKISQVLSSLDDKIEKEYLKVEVLYNLKKGLMQNMFV